ncbi:Wzz/FepE/Etk N-terminal domain-containing protein [Sporosarcina limicola]|uniref:Capsular polysaccharide biosynthesis protein n=1 Tax=Sporosarcina limicola TaxID=34101 RepID=A0A927MKI5_9BACL|nr:Wzz/FepE/Etk N-terminal domain-containing protein [Sporosarcina limicola]MBE1556414.1 capsular polysaccharide biosynthesis protein [Sporosarcina limicola]
MEETIELRELIETVWKGKWIIAGLTALFMFAAAILSWFVLPEQYESKATVQVASEVQDTGIMSSYVAAEFTPIVFSQRFKNEVHMNEALQEVGVAKKFNPKNLSTSIQVGTDLVDLSYKSTSAKVANEHLTLFIDKTKERMNTSVKSTLNELEKTYTSESSQLSAEIETLIEQYNNVVVFNKLPEILIMQTLVNSQIILTVSDDQLTALAKVNGALHNELMQMKAQITSKSAEYQRVLDKYQSVKTGLDSFRPDPFIRTIIEPTIPEKPVAPNKVLNVAIAMIIGLMAGLGFIFFRQYWKNSASTK